MKRTVTALSLVALLAIAVPASAKQKTLYYNGKTNGGYSLSFKLKGNRISDMRGYVTSTCVPDHGTPTTRAVNFDPPGAFRMGRTRKVSNTVDVDWWGNTTFNYTVSVKKKKGRLWVAGLHVNFSAVEAQLGDGASVDQTLYICQFDDAFRFLLPAHG